MEVSLVERVLSNLIEFMVVVERDSPACSLWSQNKRLHFHKIQAANPNPGGGWRRSKVSNKTWKLLKRNTLSLSGISRCHGRSYRRNTDQENAQTILKNKPRRQRQFGFSVLVLSDHFLILNPLNVFILPHLHLVLEEVEAFGVGGGHRVKWWRDQFDPAQCKRGVTSSRVRLINRLFISTWTLLMERRLQVTTL